MKKNLVMGVAQHYSWYAVEPFVNSFLKHRADNTELVLFVDDISEYTRDRLTKQGGGCDSSIIP